VTFIDFYLHTYLLQFNITKLQLLEAEKAKVRREYERREGATEVRKKVEFSKQLNESRLKILQAQDDAIRAIQKDAQNRLGALSNDQNAYGSLLQGLLMEALFKLGEPKVKVRCREADNTLVRAVIPQAASTFEQRYGKTAPTVELDEQHSLPPAAAQGGFEEFDTCAGGLVVTSADGRIVCSNTLDDRLAIAYGGNLPSIRAMLFGTAASN
jgi:V-type H+-transporting ATPase subunit E